MWVCHVGGAIRSTHYLSAAHPASRSFYLSPSHVPATPSHTLPHPPKSANFNMSETKSSTNDAKRQKTEGDARESRETDDVRVAGYRPLLPPACLVEDLPLSKETQAFIKESRRSVQAILEVRCAVRAPLPLLRHCLLLLPIKRLLLLLLYCCYTAAACGGRCDNGGRPRFVGASRGVGNGVDISTGGHVRTGADTDPYHRPVQRNAYGRQSAVVCIGDRPLTGSHCQSSLAHRHDRSTRLLPSTALAANRRSLTATHPYSPPPHLSHATNVSPSRCPLPFHTRHDLTHTRAHTHTHTHTGHRRPPCDRRRALLDP